MHHLIPWFRHINHYLRVCSNNKTTKKSNSCVIDKPAEITNNRRRDVELVPTFSSPSTKRRHYRGLFHNDNTYLIADNVAYVEVHPTDKVALSGFLGPFLIKVELRLIWMMPSRIDSGKMILIETKTDFCVIRATFLVNLILILMRFWLLRG